MVYKWVQRAQSWLFPSICQLCCAAGQPGLEICGPCAQELPWLIHTCHGCARPLPSDAPVSRCPDCLQQPPALDHCEALFGYREPVTTWVQNLKFHQDLAAAQLLGKLLADHLPTAPPDSLVIPVPLHRKRLAERGYNQALEIARPLRQRGYLLKPQYCRRHKPTHAQSDLPASRRRANLSDAFSASPQVRGQNVTLIDDVLTTGATLNELAATLKRAGALRVEARVIARTLRDHPAR